MKRLKNTTQTIIHNTLKMPKGNQKLYIEGQTYNGYNGQRVIRSVYRRADIQWIQWPKGNQKLYIEGQTYNGQRVIRICISKGRPTMDTMAKG